jgi:hypothetical protein
MKTCNILRALYKKKKKNVNMLSNFRDGAAWRFCITFARHSPPSFIYLIFPLCVQTLFTLTWQLTWNFMPRKKNCGFITETWRIDNEFVVCFRFLQPRVPDGRRRTLSFGTSLQLTYRRRVRHHHHHHHIQAIGPLAHFLLIKMSSIKSVFQFLFRV